ncbi:MULTISPECIES: trans-sulfuration enzyme family protein [Bacillus]|uniref:homocysteine desulfhydrase n=2 Tax=Bacillus TaxID=1386 RepID=A0A0M4FN68_9BACI|nr:MULTISPECIES: aminotransferase class I/II-fold pyridoxal phosphate-dependent enzyme [Bacillus]ALC80273.1 cystathionine gamma-synthase [Bacillus gobiensis]MBP1083895.1 methionine-gamma-lyase [Bacillus capparidis]MED1098376.1 aminotransferase class I/II-fold pyridoxal phosphate-dependent enzyme [Bacillus capparidis]
MNQNFKTMVTRLGSHNPTSLSVPENIPITMSSVFAFDDVESLNKVYNGDAEGFIYSRMTNPVHEALKEVMFSIDEGEDALVFSSGMAAITSTLITHLHSGDHVLASHVLYGETYEFLKYQLKKFNIDVTFVDFSNDNWEQYFTPKTKLVYTETISNPMMAVDNLTEIANIAHDYHAKLVVDNTFATPIVCQPLNLGADIVVYSATKYLCGHGDVTGGIVVSNKETISAIDKVGTLYGGCISPFDAWILIRSLKTLELRMREHSNNALKLADFFEGHPKINKVYYPGLQSSPSFNPASSFFNNELYGGMLSVDLKGNDESYRTFIDNLEGIKFVPSLADVKTSVCSPAITSHRNLSDNELKQAGISKGLIRISTGLENIDDLISEFDKVLNLI